MCLDTITKRNETPTKSITAAWKVFEQPNGGGYLTFEYATLRNGSAVVPRGKWLKASRSASTTLSQAYSYTPGFHCYTNEADARSYAPRCNVVVTKVRVRGITYRGTKRGGPRIGNERKVLVAREMYVPLPKKSKEKK